MSERPSTFMRVFFPLTLLAGLVGFGLTIYVIWQAFVVLPPHMPHGAFTINARPTTPDGNPMKLYESYRVFFLHLPSALASATASTLMAIGGILYLISKRSVWDSLLTAAVQVAVVSCFLTMATGYLWGEFAWGTGWTWEPRLTSTLVLWLSYVALLLLRAAIDDAPRRRLFSAVYAVLTAPLYWLVSKSIELFGRGSHPPSLKDLLTDNDVSRLQQIAVPGVILLFVFFILLRFWQLRMADETRALRTNAA